MSPKLAVYGLYAVMVLQLVIAAGFVRVRNWPDALMYVCACLMNLSVLVRQP